MSHPQLPTALEVVNEVLDRYVTPEQLDKMTNVLKGQQHMRDWLVEAASYMKARYSIKKSLKIAEEKIQRIHMDSPTFIDRRAFIHLFVRTLLKGAELKKIWRFKRDEAISLVTDLLIHHCPRGNLDWTTTISTVTCLLPSRIEFQNPIYDGKEIFLKTVEDDIVSFFAHEEPNVENILILLEFFFERGKLNKIFKEFPVLISVTCSTCIALPGFLMAIITLLAR